MEQTSLLQMPSFLYGAYNTAQRKAHTEGRRCGAQYRKAGSFPPPLELVALPPGEVVIAHDVVDFDRARPAWRLYMVTDVMDGLCDALDWENVYPVCDAYEAAARQAAWGALYFVFARIAPKGAEKTALRLEAMLRFWEPLQSVRYLFTSPNVPISLEQLLEASINWAMDAWCPESSASVRERLETAAARMARATKEDCLEAIFRQMPRAFASADGLKHRPLLMDPGFLRERLATLTPELFERISGACTADLMAQLYDWDYQLGLQ
ncbi:MAG TPA: hypothetical protein VF815_38845 [Myxococcaceae bacterium]|jgi:hypothetical protein